ncbi:MAG: efflux transporter outer membrane subunit [Legionella sp.]|jgi:NodT family efflux transporter outer membrane factor (OMF) lipoprotein
MVQPADNTNLAVQHVYKIPKAKTNTSRFNDPQLDQLITVALVDSPTMLSANARLDRAIQAAKGAKAAMWPTLGLRGAVQQQYFPLSGTIPLAVKSLDLSQVSAETLALNFSYQVDFWGKNRHALASKISEAVATGMDAAQTRLLLSAAVANAYFDLQNNIKQVALTKEYLRLQKELYAIAADREKHGIESNIPVTTALSAIQITATNLQDYKRAQMLSRHQLAVLMGKNPMNTEIETSAFSYNSKQLALPEIIPANLLAQRPDILAAKALAESAAHQIRVAKAAFYPNINLKGILSYQNLYFNNFFNINFPNNGATAALDLPIFDAGARKANLRTSYANYDLAVNQYNQTILNALKEVVDQISNLQTLNNQVQEQNQAVNAIQTNYNLIKSRYNQGIIDYVQLIQVKQNLIQQQTVLFTLQTRQKQAYITLLAALGGEVSHD